MVASIFVLISSILAANTNSHQLIQSTESNPDNRFDALNNHTIVYPNYPSIPNTTSSMIYDFFNISINSTPAGAEVWIDGNNSCQLTPCEFTFRKSENHSLELRLDGYDPHMMNITTSNSLDVNVNLTTGPEFCVSRGPSMGAPHVDVKIISSPPGAEVWKDSENTGKLTPFYELSGVYETHNYELRMDGKDYKIPTINGEHDMIITVPLK
jgi:hypothetical protein